MEQIKLQNIITKIINNNNKNKNELCIEKNNNVKLSKYIDEIIQLINKLNDEKKNYSQIITDNLTIVTQQINDLNNKNIKITKSNLIYQKIIYLLCFIIICGFIYKIITNYI
jgi:hypothetical protein